MNLYKNGDCISLTDENFIAGYKANGWVETPPVAPVEDEIVDLGLIEDEPVKEEKTEVVEPKKASAPKKTTSKKSGSKKAKK